LAFKLKRKGFVIEVLELARLFEPLSHMAVSLQMLHLPPELGETAARPQEDPAERVKSTSRSKTLCQPNPTKHNSLDF
jgi:hypothetical protein